MQWMDRAEMGEEEAEEISLVREAELINALLSSSYSTRSFPVKWQLIRNKLSQLHSGLSAADGDGDCRKNFELIKLLQGITSTARDTQVLITLCSDESYSGGKLLLRSDLDAIITKLDIHINGLSSLYASGVLTQARAIVVSKPGAGASREDMRFYVKDLFGRLKIGDSKMRIEALASLSEILHEDERYVKIAADEGSDGYSILVNLLENEDMGVQEEASEAVSVIAGLDSYRGSLVVAGVIAPLIQVLEIGSSLAKERAAKAMKCLTENADNAWSVCAHGGVTAMLKICSDSDSSAELVCSACGVLKSLCGVNEIKRFIVEEGAVDVFTKLLRSKEEVCQIQGIEFLTTIACDEPAIQQKVVQERVVESFVRVLDPNSSHSSKAREVALRSIEVLCFSSVNSMNRLIGSGFLNRVLFFLKNGEISIQQSAFKAACRLCGISEEIKKAMGDAGFMPELIRMLEGRSFEIREMAAEALCNMISVQRNRRRFIQEEHNVNRVLQLLSLEEKSATKKFLLSALMYITDSNSGRRKIVSSKYVKHLEKLAETNVADAKKIIKKLAGNKIRSLFNGIWNL
ncbi:protein CELLULOSE SYNTHASE INTERACTIVE 1 [Typha latifolia]|uniref:protein CELLULOSE SYNTHASE INTERACTIVE 1 n=1 Tax=Typha latifolia TaxID=4733 RepID=UPI003C2BE7C8